MYQSTGEVLAIVEDEFCTLGGIQVVLEYRLSDAFRRADRTHASGLVYNHDSHE